MRLLLKEDGLMPEDIEVVDGTDGILWFITAFHAATIIAVGSLVWKPVTELVVSILLTLFP